MVSGSVFLVWHSIDPNDDDNTKLLGVFSTHEAAEDRIARARSVAGFVDFPDGFLIDEYAVDQDHWVEGFVVISPEGWPAPDAVGKQGNAEFGEPD